MIISNTTLAVEKENKLHAWGFMRGKEGIQADFDKTSKDIIEKYDGIVVGNNEEKTIYITFDLGYEAGYTEKILDVLKKQDVKASFFITGHYLNTAEELVKRIKEASNNKFIYDVIEELKNDSRIQKRSIQI